MGTFSCSKYSCAIIPLWQMVLFSHEIELSSIAFLFILLQRFNTKDKREIITKGWTRSLTQLCPFIVFPVQRLFWDFVKDVPHFLSFFFFFLILYYFHFSSFFFFFNRLSFWLEITKTKTNKQKTNKQKNQAATILLTEFRGKSLLLE